MTFVNQNVLLKTKKKNGFFSDILKDSWIRLIQTYGMGREKEPHKKKLQFKSVAF